MGEHLLCKQEVVGSIPIASTKAYCLYQDVARRSCVSDRLMGRRGGLKGNTVLPAARAAGRLFVIVNRSWISVGFRIPVCKGDGNCGSSKVSDAE